MPHLPSPLAGEGMDALPQAMMGEGASSQDDSFEETPLTHSLLLRLRVALSLKEKGFYSVDNSH
jgi:hypothetical protein